MTRILVVEDSPGIAESLKANLEVEGFRVQVAADGEAGRVLWGEWQPDLIVLDLMLPRLDGFALLDAMRRDGDETPVLILSARSAEIDKVRGFRLGADDYLTKPFGLMEMLARVEALLRRRKRVDGEASPATTQYGFGDIVIEVEARRVLRSGTPIMLRPREFDLLVALSRRIGHVVSKERLLREVWGYDPSVVSRTVDTHILELRRRLEVDPAHPRHVKTLRGAGYKIEP